MDSRQAVPPPDPQFSPLYNGTSTTPFPGLLGGLHRQHGYEGDLNYKDWDMPSPCLRFNTDRFLHAPTPYLQVSLFSLGTFALSRRQWGGRQKP